MTADYAEDALAYGWVAEHMHVEEVQALNQFVAINPNQRGIPWWDALSMLTDCDAHLGIIEPMAEAIKDAGGQWTLLHSYVTLTLIYASSPFLNEWDTPMRVTVLQATIENNTR